jgi:hypothetical protein
MNEIWKKVSWSDDYEVSNLGNVRSWRPVGNSKEKPDSPKIMTQWFSNGYPSVTLCIKQVRKNFLVHRLVAETFIGPSMKNTVVCHIDDIKTNNIVTNLKYGTYSENAKDAVKNKKLASGENHPNAKLSNADIDTIRHLVLSLGKTHQQVADIFGVARTTISGIMNSRRKVV